MKSKRQVRLERKQAAQRRNQLKWLGTVIVGAIIIAIVLALAGQVRQPTAGRTYSQTNGNSIGDPNAPVTVIEYGDYQCPHCQNVYLQTEEPFITNYVYTGKVFYTYRSMGDMLGPDSAKAAEGAYCAADQNMFWEFRSLIFTNFAYGNNGGYSESRLNDFAKALNLDMGAFQQCLSSGAKADQVAQDQADGLNQGINGTPAFLINGQLIPGEMTYDQLAQQIESALAAVGN